MLSRARIFRVLQATAFGQLVNIVIQVASLPLFVLHWGAQVYGEWLQLAALPAYLALSDIGFASVAANKMAMSRARGELLEVKETYHSAWALVSLITLTLVVVFSATAFLVPLDKLLKIPTLAPFAPEVVALFSVCVCLGLQAQILLTVYRCEGRYASGVFFINLTRLAEFGSTAVCLWCGASPTWLVGWMVIVRICAFLAMYLHVLRFAPWASFSPSQARPRILRQLFSPAVAFMGFPAGYAISLQGAVIVVGNVLGPTSLVTFSAMRTITRVAAQGMNLINSSIWPEMSAAFGRGDMAAARKLHRRGCQAALLIASLLVIGLYLTRHLIIKYWSHGRLSLDDTTYALLLLTVFINSLWFTSSVTQAATNNHHRLATVFVFSALLSIIVGAFLSSFYQLPGMGMSLVLGELIMVATVLPISLRLTKDTPADFLRALFAF